MLMKRALVVSCDKAGLCRAGLALREGKLVAFPTETVYGLGGNALDVSAIENIFKTKGRPLTDPLIVHVCNNEEAMKIVSLSLKTEKLFNLLAAKYWPGPLTMVVPANNQVPDLVCAGTGLVGIRCPAHPVARALLKESKVPVAAPSANRFGHVSPTSAQHVLDDLGGHEILIVEEPEIEQTNKIGIESTVLKVDVSKEDSLVLYRKGGVSESSLRSTLDQAGYEDVKIVSPIKPVQEESEHQSAPGQLLTHYAPADMDTWLVKPGECDISTKIPLAECTVIDFGGLLSHIKEKARAYRDLSPEKDISVACQNLFSYLRWTETTEAKHVIIQDVSHVNHELAASIADRMYRAASGKIIC